MCMGILENYAFPPAPPFTQKKNKKHRDALTVFKENLCQKKYSKRQLKCWKKYAKPTGGDMTPNLKAMSAYQKSDKKLLLVGHMQLQV